MWSIFCLALGINSAFSLDDNIGRFWHLTDVHFDPKYSQQGDPANQCHYTNTSTGTPGYYGNYLCDSSWNLVLSAVEEMKKKEAKPDFILWTGDSVPHVVQQNVSDVYDIISNVTSAIMQIHNGTPVVPVLGNHDAFPSNQMPLVGKDNGYYKNILEKGGWSALLTKEEQQQFLAGGYYVKTYGNSSGLRFLVLNSNLWYSLNKMVVNDTDPNKQFAWLKQQLEQARDQNYKVYIVAHICPGSFERLAQMTWFYQQFNKKYVELVQEFSSTIAAHFCGHEHTDTFRLVTGKDGAPSSVMFLSPAVTPWKSPLPHVGANNPGVRLYHYARTTGRVVDYFQYYMNLTQANSDHTANQSVWQLEYQATSAYSIPDISAASLHTMLVSLSNTSSVFRRYLLYNTVSYSKPPSCDQKCFLAQTCAILHIDLYKYNDCLALSGTTPVPPPDITTKHHHRKPHPIPHYVYYIIGGMAFVIVILAVVVSCLCARRRRHGIPFKYGRLFGTIN